MPGPKGMRRRGNRLPILSIILTIAVVVYLLDCQPLAAFSTFPATQSESTCPRSARLKDVAVVLRTGATESQNKLPIHFDTVLSCVPDFIIYSDFNETIRGHQTYDVLDGVNDTIKHTVQEFKLYNHLRSRRREGLVYQTMYGSGPTGAQENRGWKLDKWKFLPMVDRVVRDRPDAKWYIFIEGDTYMLWQNMLRFLANFDATEPQYLGKHMYIDNTLFGHGGSGFVLSRPAAEMVANHWRQHLDEYDDYTQTEWAGDAILGKALKDAGVDMFSSFPNLQGDSLTTVDWNVTKLGREPWCYAPATFHHMNQAEFRELWRFEQQWLSRHGSSAPAPLFRDIFKSLVLPRLRPKVEDWDNMSSTGKEFSNGIMSKMTDGDIALLGQFERQAHFSYHHCQALCESKPACLQFSYNKGSCFISNELKLGHAVDSSCLEYSNAAGECVKSRNVEDQHRTVLGNIGMTSGWVMSRVAKYVDDLDQSCQNKGIKDLVI
ncbi:hypothetical protein E8E14_011103 [Neopestalotiopsis sp. 37M]|nr:hypothetical protein E8E14_011103 [Neopestalotiopsis sp. 37M]